MNMAFFLHDNEDTVKEKVKNWESFNLNDKWELLINEEIDYNFFMN
jgi:hypothetical protein